MSAPEPVSYLPLLPKFNAMASLCQTALRNFHSQRAVDRPAALRVLLRNALRLAVVYLGRKEAAEIALQELRGRGT